MNGLTRRAALSFVSTASAATQYQSPTTPIPMRAAFSAVTQARVSDGFGGLRWQVARTGRAGESPFHPCSFPDRLHFTSF
jgi:hypothetical protein